MDGRVKPGHDGFVCCDPGSAKHHAAQSGVLHRARETRGTLAAPHRCSRRRGSRTMKQLFGLMMLAGALGLAPAGAADGEFELAALQTPLGAGAMLPARDEAD